MAPARSTSIKNGWQSRRTKSIKMSVPWNHLMHSPLRQCLASQFIWIKPWIRCSNCCSKWMATVHAGMHRINQCRTDLWTSLVDTTVRSARHARRTHAFKCILLALNIYKWNKIKLKLSSITAIVCATRSNVLAARQKRVSRKCVVDHFARDRWLSAEQLSTKCSYFIT